MVYFSAGESVYAMRAGVAITILRGMAGYLRYSGSVLAILDPVRKRLVKITGLEKLTHVTEPGKSLQPAKFKE
jgi:hypothetical protein